ncbi:AMP-binding protein, partial [Paraburkholderia sp. SIMBA_050]
LQSIGVKPGDRVAIMLPNTFQYPVALFGTLKAGAIVVNVNPLYTPRELEHQLNDSGAEAIILLDSCVATLDAIIAHTQVKHVLVATQGGPTATTQAPGAHTTFDDAIAEGRERPFVPARLSPDDIAFL